MSTILDALRRLQRERESVGQGELGEALLGDPVEPVRRRRWVWVATGLVLLLAGGGSLAYFALGEDLLDLGGDDSGQPRAAGRRAEEPRAEAPPSRAAPRAQRTPPRVVSPVLPRPRPVARAPRPRPSPVAVPETRTATPPAPAPTSPPRAAAAAPTPAATPPPSARGRVIRPAPLDPPPAPTASTAAPSSEREVARPIPLALRSTLGLTKQGGEGEPGARGRQDESRGSLLFPELTVETVRWHPEPARRRARILLDASRPVEAREGDIVAGVAVERIEPGAVELRLGSARKRIKIGS